MQTARSGCTLDHYPCDASWSAVADDVVLTDVGCVSATSFVAEWPKRAEIKQRILLNNKTLIPKKYKVSMQTNEVHVTNYFENCNTIQDYFQVTIV